MAPEATPTSAARTTALEVILVLEMAQARHGPPAALLTDNGALYSGESRGGKAPLETTLAGLGIVRKRSRPYHPQTLGEVERSGKLTLRHGSRLLHIGMERRIRAGMSC